MFAALVESDPTAREMPAAGPVATTTAAQAVLHASFRPVAVPTSAKPGPPAPAGTATPVVAAAAAPVAPPVAPPPAPQDEITGKASWYSTVPGTCASPRLPFGTVVTVTDLADGASLHCTVEDRQAVAAGRVIDLSETAFSQLAGLSVGVVEVRLTW